MSDLLIFKQEKLFGRAREGNLGSRRIFLSWRATKKTLSGPLFAHPCSKMIYAVLGLCIMSPVGDGVWR
jgi:hypothetical protein